MLIMIDGLDRCGKDSLVEQLRKKFTHPEIQVFHEGAPPKVADPRQWAISHYDFMLRNARDASIFPSNVISIYNRSHIGEVVWGSKYRGYNTDFVFDLERRYLSTIDPWNVYLILLTDTADRLMERDDGKSLTKSKEELDEVRGLYTDAFYRSCIGNKLHIRLENTKFEDVLPTTWRFLNDESE